jgi:23S rRNA (cytosine1962-C5)-methyltransferase
MQKTGIVLKKGKERPILQHHHWIYSGAIDTFPENRKREEIFSVFSSEGKKLGLAALNPGRSIRAHMLAFGDETIEEALQQRIRNAVILRRLAFSPEQTNAFRLINAEGDGIPGLIVDAYDRILVMQIAHPALSLLRPLIEKLLIEEMNPAAIYEKSTSFLRKKEGLEEVRLLRFGEESVFMNALTIREHGLVYSVDIQKGQKTGLFLDQREMRELVRALARGKRVLNLFAYTGGFSVAALAGGAEEVVSVEISEKCRPLLEENLLLNGLDAKKHRFVCQDAFLFLKEEELNYDLMILDPPAFAKNRSSVPAAFRAYQELNRAVFTKAPNSSLLLTCSCSYQIDESLFQNILFQAARQAERPVRILGRHRQAIDHPISLYHPESSYLKSFLLYVE